MMVARSLCPERYNKVSADQMLISNKPLNEYLLLLSL